MRAFQRSRGQSGALQNDISGFSSSWITVFMGRKMGSLVSPAAQAQRAREGCPGVSDSAVFCCPSPPGAGDGLAPSLPGTAAPAQVTHRAAKNRAGEPLCEIKGFTGPGIPQELGLAPALCPAEHPEPGVPFPAGRTSHEQPPR